MGEGELLEGEVGGQQVRHVVRQPMTRKGVFYNCQTYKSRMMWL